ncbi:MAG: DUF3800 domain-containing protein [Planctomycetaceae bacterium]
MSLEYVIFTDESEKDGPFYSNFYGGILIRSPDLLAVTAELEQCKLRLNLHREVKWQKVTANYLAKYEELMDAFVDLVATDRVKVRIMFTQNRIVPTNRTAEQRRTTYHRLYYQFVKHAFGLPFSNDGRGNISVRLNLDQMPENREQNSQFKSYIVALDQNPQMQRAGIRFHAARISEVRSHDHIPLQCLDVVLGAMSFRLNDRHRAKLPGSRRRGKRTIAKENLYRSIRRRVCAIRPNFNIGETTGKDGDLATLWKHPYRHWKFVPREHEIDSSRSKK